MTLWSVWARIHRLSLQEQPGTVPADAFTDLREAVSAIWLEVMGAPVEDG